MTAKPPEVRLVKNSVMRSIEAAGDLHKRTIKLEERQHYVKRLISDDSARSGHNTNQNIGSELTSVLPTNTRDSRFCGSAWARKYEVIFHKFSISP